MSEDCCIKLCWYLSYGDFEIFCSVDVSPSRQWVSVFSSIKSNQAFFPEQKYWTKIAKQKNHKTFWSFVSVNFSTNSLNLYISRGFFSFHRETKLPWKLLHCKVNSWDFAFSKLIFRRSCASFYKDYMKSKHWGKKILR